VTYNQWLTTLQQDNNIMGGEPTFYNTRVTVKRIGSLVVNGEDPTVILQDYPFLKPHDLKFSAIFFNLNVTMKGQT
jgi:uncharacterized protein (DUF433 family)